MSGHGHVIAYADGSKARCGDACVICQIERREQLRAKTRTINAIWRNARAYAMATFRSSRKQHCG